MKTITTIIIAAAISLAAVGQKKEFKEKTLKEISGLIENAYEFVDKPASYILTAGRPASIQGGDKWEIGLIDTTEENSSPYGGAILIGTGCGALTLVLSRTTNLVEAIMYMAHKDARIRRQDLISMLQDKYSFSNGNEQVIEIADSKKIGLSVSSGMILLAAP